ncbi:hypothetical protein NC653_039584 [Populus alba x Populus x berolinensis]|uniref:Uncharacterized protein n=1 Tax=Populus alba x Populus x berolinensis TaxID=444605 RepID=A0AAD6LBJ1_9ROSI|nr:hypothetical protein NC653_039584 [Populus alba x Populus x berolinensis]
MGECHCLQNSSSSSSTSTSEKSLLLMTDRKTKTATTCVTRKYLALLRKVFSSSVLSLLGCFLGFEPTSERNCGTEEDDPASKKSVLSFSAYRMRLPCSKSALRSIDDS